MKKLITEETVRNVLESYKQCHGSFRGPRGGLTAPWQFATGYHHAGHISNNRRLWYSLAALVLPELERADAGLGRGGEIMTKQDEVVCGKCGEPLHWGVGSLMRVAGLRKMNWVHKDGRFSCAGKFLRLQALSAKE